MHKPRQMHPLNYSSPHEVANQTDRCRGGPTPGDISLPCGCVRLFCFCGSFAVILYPTDANVCGSKGIVYKRILTKKVGYISWFSTPSLFCMTTNYSGRKYEDRLDSMCILQRLGLRELAGISWLAFASRLYGLAG